jgi:hypothetical protein
VEKQERPYFDQKLADSYVGKYILVGITYYDYLDNELERNQLHGIIESATPNGIVILLKGVHSNEKWNMPPMLDSIEPAKPGRYQLLRTNEFIDNPDLLSKWKVTNPPPKH